MTKGRSQKQSFTALVYHQGDFEELRTLEQYVEDIDETPQGIEVLKDNEYYFPEILQQQEDVYLSLKIQTYVEKKVKCAVISGYNEFSYSLGVVIYQILAFDNVIDSQVNLRHDLPLIGRKYELSSGLMRLCRELLQLGSDIIQTSNFQMARLINEKIQHDIDHQVEYDVYIKQTCNYLETKGSELFIDQDDEANQFLAKGLWNTKLMVKYYPLKNTYRLFKTVQKIPQGSETVMINEFLAFVMGGYDSFTPNVIINTVYQFEFPDEDFEKDYQIDYVYQLDQRSSMIVKKINYALVSNTDFICVLGGKIHDKDDQLLITDLCEIYSINNDSWGILPSLNVKRANACACIFNNKYIYIFGGESLDYPGFHVYESVERIDLTSKHSQWVELDIGNIVGACWFSPKSQALQVNETQIYIFGGINTHAMDGEVGKSLLFTVDTENEYECELKEKDRYEKAGLNISNNIVCDQVCKSEYQIFGISSNAILDLNTQGLKNIVQIDIHDILKSYNF
ncbi:kelch motif family protein [Stylonychia lemnae]|uniref:Kelch motif family protein n=1 Tax=Stylonychia lemnae TaxID=5949 RepID=A0A078B4M0_STYLE|nr:kelch motif family protein [Stylonychia lemnae]|eukprot:CDW88453.1 kelch motif family protein [Stylonychia lemnae]